jgi:hypothetical protein
VHVDNDESDPDMPGLVAAATPTTTTTAPTPTPATRANDNGGNANANGDDGNDLVPACTTPPSSPRTAVLQRTPPRQRRTPPKRRRGVGRPKVERLCIDGKFDYTNWCTNCVYGSKRNGKFKKSCKGPRLIPPPGSDYNDSDRTGVLLEGGEWASPSAPALLIGRFVEKLFVSVGGQRERFTGMVMGWEPPYFKVAFRDGDFEDLTKQELIPLLLGLDQRKPSFPYVPPHSSVRPSRRGGAGRSKYAYETGNSAHLTAERDAAVKAKKEAETTAQRLRLRVRSLRRELALTVDGEETSVAPMRLLQRTQAIGKDFASARRRREHAKFWEDAIMDKYGTDVRKQLSVARDIGRRFLNAAESDADVDICGIMYSKANLAVCVSIAESMRDYVTRLQASSTGRLTNDNRLAYRLTAQAASLVHDNRRLPGLDKRAAWLGFKRGLMAQERRRYMDWCEYYTDQLNRTAVGGNDAENDDNDGGNDDGNAGGNDNGAGGNDNGAGGNDAENDDNDGAGGNDNGGDANVRRRRRQRAPPLLYTTRGKRRSDAYPPEWAAYVAACWIEISRRGEVAREELRDRDSNDPTARVRKCFLEMRVCKAVKLITDLCQKHFSAGFTYKDGVARPAGFKGGPDYIRVLRPYYCIKSYGNRKTSLCTLCMKWEFVAMAIAKRQKDVRDRGLVPSEQPRLPTDWAEMLRCFLCPRVDEKYANLNCINNTCITCKNLRRAVGVDGRGGVLQANELTALRAIRWDRWEKAVNPVTGQHQWDFVTAVTSFDEVISEIRPPYAKPSSELGPRRGWFYEFCRHHDLAVYMGRAKAHKRVSFPLGSCHVVEDFSENGTFTVKKEFQSRYWSTHSYSLFGCVVSSRIENRVDLTEPQRNALIALMDANNLPHVIQDSHLILSEDTVHDPASVIWYNEKVLLPVLRRQMPGLKVVYLTTDGAPNQFKNKNLYYWISRAKAKLGIRIDWVIGCPAHSKDLSDSECGGAKHNVDKVNLEHKASDDVLGMRINSVSAAVAHLRQPYPIGYATPSRDIFKKKGVGIRSRSFYHVPLKTISRRITNADAFADISKYHQITDIGVEGKVLVRARPCHFCDRCMALDKEFIINECPNSDRCGQAKIVEIKASSGAAAAIRGDRNAVDTEGKRLSREAKDGDFVAIELAFENLPWLIGEVVGDDAYKIYNGPEKELYMGVVKPGDEVLRVRRWLPLHSGGGSSIFEQIEGKEGEVLAFAQDVRYIIDEPTINFKPNRRRSRAPKVDNVKAAAGAAFEYMFVDEPGKWYKGTIEEMNGDGVTAKATFDDGNPYTNLPVWGNLNGGRIKILDGGEHISLPSMTAPQRRLSPAARDIIQSTIC